MQELEATPIEAAAAATMSMGRLCSEKPMNPDEEIAFIQYMGEVVQAYFAQGSVN